MKILFLRLTIFISALLAFIFLISFLIINKKIQTGDVRIIQGQLQLSQGAESLAAGKQALKRGEQQLSEGNQMYQNVKQSSYLAVVFAPIAGVAALTGDHLMREKIHSGKTQIAEGKERIKQGEERLSKGKSQLKEGKAQLRLAKLLRIICALGTIFFSMLFIRCIISKRIF